MDKKILNIIGGALLGLAIFFGGTSYSNFTSPKKEKAEERIQKEEDFRDEFERLRTKFRNLGSYDNVRECNDEIADIDRVIREQKDIIEELDEQGNTYAVICGVCVVAGIGFLVGGATKKKVYYADGSGAGYDGNGGF